MLVQSGLNSKAQLFTYLPDSLSGFTTGELDKIDSLREVPGYDSIMIVQVADIWSIQDSGDLIVNLPGSTVTLAQVDRLN